MKIVVIGGTGLIGSKTVAILRQAGHEVVAASPKNGINTITGEGLEGGAGRREVVIDLANSPSFEDKAVLEFFETSGRNLLAARGRGRRQASCRAVDRRNRPDARQRLFPRQGRPGEADRGLRHSLHHRPLDPVHGIPRRHRRVERGWKHGQAFARPVPADRSRRRRASRCRCGACAAAQRHRRDRRPGTRAVQRDHRPLPEGGRRSRAGRARSRGALLRRARRGALAGAAWAKRASAASRSTNGSAAHRAAA